MLARYMPWHCVCLSVCLSVTSRSSIKTAQWIELIFGMEVSFHLSYTVLYRNADNSKNNGTSSGTLSRMQDLEYFASASGRCRGAVNKSIKTDGDRGPWVTPNHAKPPHFVHFNTFYISITVEDRDFKFDG